MNGQYLMRMTADEIEPHLRPFLPAHAPALDQIRAAVDLNKARGRTLRELAANLEPYFIADDAVAYDPEAVKKHLKGDDLAQRMNDLYNVLAETQPFDVAATEQALRGLAEQQGNSAGKYIHPLRVALTGKLASPPIFDVAVTLGRERTLRRLQLLIERLKDSG
jgi:glutamyl-tRNA synthetase